MAETTDTKPEASKSSKGSFLKKKVAGVPMPIVLLGGGVVAYLVYRHFHSNSSASTSSTATPTASSGTAPANGLSGGANGLSGGANGLSGGANGLSGGGAANGLSGGSGSGYTPTFPWSPTGTKATTKAKSTLKPIGKKVLKIGGQSFSTVSGFVQGGNTYYGVNNPAEAKRLEQLGVRLVHNPNDPNSTALFIFKPKGATAVPVSHPRSGPSSPVATGTTSSTGADYAGTGATGSRGTPSQIRAANERRAANVKAANQRMAANRKRAAAQHKLPVATIANRRSGKP